MKLKTANPGLYKYPPSRSQYLPPGRCCKAAFDAAKRLLPGDCWTQVTKHKGFTMIELLIVMGIMTTLTTLIFVSLDPITRFSEARDARRTTDVNSILTAI